MRVLHVTDVYLPKLGGIEKQVSGLAKAQHLAGHDVHILTASAAEESDPKIHRLPSRGFLGLPLNFTAGPAISKLVEQLQPDVVHIHLGVVSQFAWLVYFRLRTRVKIVATVHSVWGPIAVGFYRIANRVFKFTREVSFSSVSNPAAARVQKALNVHVSVTPNGVDLSHWVLGVGESHAPLKLVTASRLAARKRVLPLIFVAAALNRKVGPGRFSLAIAGSGIAQLILQLWVKILRLAEVRFVGRLKADELHQLYTHSDLYIQLSTKEAFGLAAIEARASGLPVIGRSGSGFIEFITPGQDGELLPADSAVTEYLARVIEQPALLDDLKLHARVRPIHGWKLALAEVEKLYSFDPAP